MNMAYVEQEALTLLCMPFTNSNDRVSCKKMIAKVMLVWEKIVGIIEVVQGMEVEVMFECLA